jgi:hypothetical protein
MTKIYQPKSPRYSIHVSSKLGTVLEEEHHHVVYEVGEYSHIFAELRQATAEEIEEGVDSVLPHPRWHGGLCCKKFEGRGRQWMLRGHEEIVVLVQQDPVKCNERLPVLFAVNCVSATFDHS